MASPSRRSARHALKELGKAAVWGILVAVVAAAVNNLWNGGPVLDMSVLQTAWGYIVANFSTPESLIRTSTSALLLLVVAFLWFFKKYFNTGNLPPRWGVYIMGGGLTVLVLLFPGFFGVPANLVNISIIHSNPLVSGLVAIALIAGGGYFAYTQFQRGES